MKQRFVYGGSKRIALEVSGVLSRVPLHPYGTFSGNGQTFTFDDRSLESVRAQLQDQGVPWPLDYHHASIKVEQGQADRAPRAASITDVIVEDGWVYGIVSDWVESALSSVTAGDYAYISSVLYHLTDGPDAGLVVGYHSHALTNKPATQNQRRIGLEQSDKEIIMNEWLLRLLGLPADATEDQARAALENVTVRAGLADVLFTALEVNAPTNTPELRGRIVRLAALEGIAEDLARATAALEAQSVQATSERVDGALSAALESGRIFAPEQAMWRVQLERDFDAGRVALEGMPVRVPTVPVVVAPGKSGTAALEAGQVAINNQLGVSAEDFAKYAGGDA